MSELIAKPVVKNKFWVVEESGNKIATIQAVNDGIVVYVHDEQREYFPSVKNLKQKYNIKFGSIEKFKKDSNKTVYGYPVTGKPYNQVWDVQRRLPIYSKTEKSKSLFCAGYYLININSIWHEHYCPKNITVGRYKYIGPFKTKEEMNNTLKELECKN
jgi:hypothetical protein